MWAETLLVLQARGLGVLGVGGGWALGAGRQWVRGVGSVQALLAALQWGLRVAGQQIPGIGFQ